MLLPFKIQLNVDRGAIIMVAILTLIISFVSAIFSTIGNQLPLVIALDMKAGFPVAQATFFISWIISLTAWITRWLVPPPPPPPPPRKPRSPFVPKGGEEHWS